MSDTDYNNLALVRQGTIFSSSPVPLGTHHCKRAGVILYGVTPYKEVVYAFGVDTQSKGDKPEGDISDWGGTVAYNENLYDAAVRELREETFCCVRVSPSVLVDCSYIYSSKYKSVSFLLQIPLQTLLKLPVQFEQAMGNRVGEMSGVKLLSMGDIARYVIGKKFYRVVRRMLKESLQSFYYFNQNCGGLRTAIQEPSDDKEDSQSVNPQLTKGDCQPTNLRPTGNRATTDAVYTSKRRRPQT